MTEGADRLSFLLHIFEHGDRVLYKRDGQDRCVRSREGCFPG